MLQTLREELGMSRPELAAAIGRSTNYVVKAEQATFPTPPTALVDYLAKRMAAKHVLPDPTTTTLITGSAIPAPVGSTDIQYWQDLIKSGYREFQALKRQHWIANWVPRPYDTYNFSFCRKWIISNPLDTIDMSALDISPNEYTVSKGLCVPAAVVFRAEKYGVIGNALVEAVEEVAAYLSTGKGVELQSYKFGESYDITNGVYRILGELQRKQESNRKAKKAS